MNKLLAEGLSAFNALLALALTVISAVAGGARWGAEGLFVGFLIGCAIAIVICGTLAIFVDMRSELIASRSAIAEQSKMQADALSAISRQLGALHHVLADPPAPKASVSLGWCPACGQRRVLDSKSCVWCGVERPAVAAKPDVETHA